MVMPDLPLDLVDEILTRVPTTSLTRFRSTCKRWNALFKDQRFIDTHLRFHEAAKQFHLLMLKEFRVCNVNLNLDVASPSIEFKGALGLKDDHSNSEEVDTVNVSHCDGLLLCTTKDYKVVVWNPCLGETRWIQPKTSYTSYSRFDLGYQNNKSCRSYKILRCWDSLNYKINDRFEIFELSSDSWRFLDEIALDCVIHRKSVSSKGNTFWIALDMKERYKFVLMFDFTTERFKHLSLPPFQSTVGCMYLSVVREEQLSVVRVLKKSSVSQNMEIWVTNKIDTEEALSWSKSFTVDFKNTPCDLDSVFVSCLINEEKKVVLCCGIGREIGMHMVYTIGEDGGYYIATPYVDDSTNKSGLFGYRTKVWWPFIFHYVPSLVHIF